MALMFLVLGIANRIFPADVNGAMHVVLFSKAVLSVLDLNIPTAYLRKAAASAENQVIPHNIACTGLGLNFAVGGIIFVGCLIYSIFIPLGGATSSSAEKLVIFSLLGATLWVDLLQQFLVASSNAVEKFKQAAAFGATYSTFSSAGMLVGLVAFKNLEGVFGGGLFGSLVGLLVNSARKRKEGFRWVEGFKFDRTEATALVKFAGMTLPGNILSRLGRNIDKGIILAVLGAPTLALYQNILRIPESIDDLMNRVHDVSTPRMARFAVNGNKEELISFSLQALKIISTAGIVVGGLFSATGNQVLMAVFGLKSLPNAELVLVLMGGYYAMELALGVLTRVATVSAKAYIGWPFSIFNSVCTLTFTGFAAKNFGLNGVGVMNLCIDLVQIGVFSFVVDHYVFQGRFRLKISGMMYRFFGVSFVLLGGIFMLSEYARNSFGLWSIMAYPILVIPTTWAVVYFAGGAIPSQLAAFIRKKFSLAKQAT